MVSLLQMVLWKARTTRHCMCTLYASGCCFVYLFLFMPSKVFSYYFVCSFICCKFQLWILVWCFSFCTGSYESLQLLFVNIVSFILSLLCSDSCHCSVLLFLCCWVCTFLRDVFFSPDVHAFVNCNCCGASHALFFPFVAHQCTCLL